ncbi:MAG: hypothetical protein M3Y33_21975 [Actinomycetota bacterium]|nr:hypothetical protein [Actinomycetota bacterium]
MPRLAAPVVPAGSLSRAAQPTLQAGELILGPWAEADAAALITAFADPSLQRWHDRTVESPAEAAAMKAGFAYEGTRRRACLHADGWHDLHLHARIQGDA